MRSLILAFTVMLSALGGVAAFAQEPTTVVLTEKNFDKEISVKPGDIVEVKLPAQLPLEWSLSKPIPLLSEAKGFPRFENAPPPKPGETLGAPGLTLHRFEVVGESTMPVELTLIYSKFGKPGLTAQRIEQGLIPKPAAFRPDQKPSDLREGMVYHVKLKIAG